MISMIRNINVLSLFDGMSCGQLALQRSGVGVDTYYASEIDKHAMQVTKKNFPGTKFLGDVTKWREWGIDWKSIDLLIGGSPCQGFSFAGKQLNFEDPRSKLFFVFVDILNHIETVNPDVKFLLENVAMKKEYEQIISDYLLAEPIKINSALVSAQNRKRLYWTNIHNIAIPKDKNISAISILQSNVRSEFYVSEKQMQRLNLGNLVRFGGIAFQSEGSEKIKCDALLARHYKGISGKQHFPVVLEINGLRKLTPIECERLQTVPDNYTGGGQ